RYCKSRLRRRWRTDRPARYHEAGVTLFPPLFVYNGYSMKTFCYSALLARQSARDDRLSRYLLAVVLTLVLLAGGAVWGQSPAPPPSAGSPAVTAAADGGSPPSDATLSAIRAAVRKLEAGELAVRD